MWKLVDIPDAEPASRRIHCPETRYDEIEVPGAEPDGQGGFRPVMRKRPRGPAERAKERAAELEALAFAYGVIAPVRDDQGSIALRAATITIEALKAWERAHPPAPLDPLLVDYAAGKEV